MDLRAPDGSNQPVNTETVQQIGALPPYSTAIVFVGGSSDWEQAGVVYINGVRQQQLVGNFNRPRQFTLGERDFEQVVAVAGWHKRSTPDAHQPWRASRGRVQDGQGSWDDSWGDLDFNDLTIQMQRLTGTVHP